MYSDRRYSLARYSVNRADKTVAAAESFSEALGALAGVAVPVDFRERYAEACQGSARGTVSLASGFSGREALEARARMWADVLAGAVLAGALSAAVYGQKNTPAAFRAGEKMEAAPWAAKDLPMALAAADSLESAAAGSKNVLAALTLSEALTSMLEAGSQTVERAVFQLAIPPGGELRIDSGLFSVLLNGENALHAQSGDWVELSRSLLRLTVESASGGGLEGQIIYTERFL